jgi:hypothetical protein
MILPSLAREVLGLGPIGVVLLATPAFAVAASVVAIAARGAVGRVAAGAAVSALLVDLVSAWAAVAGPRARFVRDVMHPDSAGSSWPSLTLARAIVAEHAGAGTALLVIPLVAAGVAVAWVRAARGLRARAFALAFPAALALPAWLAAAASFRATDAAPFAWCGCGPRCRYDAILDAGAPLDAARPWLLAGGALGACVVFALLVRARHVASTRLRLGCAALGAAGLAAYAISRPLAEDAARPLPFEEPAGSFVDADALQLPRGPRSAMVEAPIVVVDRSGAMGVDGARATGVGEVGDALEFKRAVWSIVNPGRSFPGVVVVAAPADMPAAEPLRVVAIAHATGYPHVLAAVASPVAGVDSRTLGPIVRPPRLGAVTVADAPASASERWGDRVAP